MADDAVSTILCLASYEKGAGFLQACHQQGWRVVLLTVPSLEDAPSWPRGSLDTLYCMTDLSENKAVIDGVSYLARSRSIRRVVALDDYDVEMAAALREHLQLPGSGCSAARVVRDKLAMRHAARRADIRVPRFTAAINDAEVAAFLVDVPPPWMLKPRSEVSTIGINRVENADDCWNALEQLEDRRSFHLLEQFIPGTVYHVDSLISDGRVVFAEAHRYARPPLEVYHGGGIAMTATVLHGSQDEHELLSLNRQVAAALNVGDGAYHIEFIRGEADGQLYFLEIGARVGGANIADVVRAASGIDLWGEWARIETAADRHTVYEVPPRRHDYGGAVISLARQEYPDTSSYVDPEIAERISRPHHVGFIVASDDSSRVTTLLESYSRRISVDFHAALPPWMSRPPSPGMSSPEGTP